METEVFFEIKLVPAQFTLFSGYNNSDFWDLILWFEQDYVVYMGIPKYSFDKVMDM